MLHNHHPVEKDPRQSGLTLVGGIAVAYHLVPEPTDVAMSQIQRVAQSEAGFEMSCQRHGLLMACPMRLPRGEAWSVDIRMQIRGKE